MFYLDLTTCALFQFTMSSEDVYVNQVVLAGPSKGKGTHVGQGLQRNEFENVYQDLQHQQLCDTEDTYEDIPMASTLKPIGRMNVAEISDKNLVIYF